MQCHWHIPALPGCALSCPGICQVCPIVSRDLGPSSFIPDSLSFSQICVGVGKSKENEGFIKVTSGKKRGLVPADALTEI